MKAICFSGQMGTGKTEAAVYVAKKLGFEKKSFASAVKKIYCDAFDVDMNFIEKWKRNKDVPTGMLRNVRKSLQFIGDGFRGIQSDVWVRKVLDNCTQNIVVDDGRYLGESDAIAKFGGYNIVLFRPGYENTDDNASESEILPVASWCNRNMQSSGEITQGPEFMKNYHYFILNDGDLQDLNSKLDVFIKWFSEKGI